LGEGTGTAKNQCDVQLYYPHQQTRYSFHEKGEPGAGPTHSCGCWWSHIEGEIQFPASDETVNFHSRTSDAVPGWPLLQLTSVALLRQTTRRRPTCVSAYLAVPTRGTNRSPSPLPALTPRAIVGIDPDFSRLEADVSNLCQLICNRKIRYEFDEASLIVNEQQRGVGRLTFQSTKHSEYGSSPPNRLETTVVLPLKWCNFQIPDSGRHSGTQSRRFLQHPEHDGLLGSGTYPRPSGYARSSAPKARMAGHFQLNRTHEPYQPPRPYKVRLSENTDINGGEEVLYHNDETSKVRNLVLYRCIAQLSVRPPTMRHMVLDLDTESYTGPWLDQYGAGNYYIPTWYTGILAGTEKVGRGLTDQIVVLFSRIKILKQMKKHGFRQFLNLLNLLVGLSKKVNLICSGLVG
ncbi:hypothetical protein BHE74_00021202, partial [Ensete ventricosum]